MLTQSRMMSLGLPLLLGYLTWSTVGGGVGSTASFTTAPAAAEHYKARDGGAASHVTTRDPFSQTVQEKVADILAGPASAALGQAAVGKNVRTAEPRPMKLAGTAIMGKLRLAFIDGVRLREGERYRGLTVSVIAVDRVILTDARGNNVVVTLEVGTSDEVKKLVANSTDRKKEQTSVPEADNQPPLHRGIAALTGTGSQKEILQMLGIPES